MKEWCDFAYALWVEDVMAQALIDRGISGTLKAAGADVDLVDPGEVRVAFDAMLAAPLVAAAGDDDEARLLKFLGVR